MHKADLSAGSQLNTAISAIADGVTAICLYPLAVFCAATAIVAFRTGALPRWLAAGAAVTAAALAVYVDNDPWPAKTVCLTVLAGRGIWKTGRSYTFADMRARRLG